MSARELLQARVIVALREAEGLVGVGVFDAPPVRAAAPNLVVEEPLLADWSAKGVSGREGRVAVLIRDAGERPVRLRGLTAAAEDAIERIGPALDEGWRIVVLTLARSRIVRERDGDWVSMSEFRVRMMRTN